MELKIGDLAKSAGLTVRTLHHYDSIKLLSPSERTAAGARLYGRTDLIRLHRVQTLKQLGYSLRDIRIVLDDTNISPLDIVLRQASVLEKQALQAQALARKLRHLANQMSLGGESQGSDWLDVLEMMTIYERHLTDEETQALNDSSKDATRELSKQWRQLVAEVESAIQLKLNPDMPDAGALAWRWVRLVIAVTGNSAALAGKLKTLQERERRAQEILGIGPAMLQWIGQAIAHARIALFAKSLSPGQTAEVARRQLATMAHMEQWPNLVALVREQMTAGVSYKAKPMRVLAQRWDQLFRDAYCGHDLALEAKVRQAFALEPELSLGVGVDRALMKYIHAAVAAVGKNTKSKIEIS
jgi:DNA-binding transcriptional MerR regulator